MGFFKDLGSKVGAGAKNLYNAAKNKVEKFKESNELHKKLDEAFKEEAVEFSVCYNNGKNKKYYGILIHENHLIRLDADLNMNEVVKIVDNKGNNYFIKRINPKKYLYQASIQTGVDEYTQMEKELDEIEYTNEKPKEDKPPVYNTYNITQTDNSTTYKGIKQSNINSNDSKVDKKTEVNVDVSANLQQKKGE